MEKFAGKDPKIKYNLDTGKRSYINKDTKIAVVVDMLGDYFRIENTSLGRRTRQYFTLDGKLPNNVKLQNGKTRGLHPHEYEMITHFMIGESYKPPKNPLNPKY